MYTHHKNLLVLALTAALGAAPLAQAATTTSPAPEKVMGSTERHHARQAQALLDKAVAYLQSSGPEQALTAFNDRQGRFVDGQYYLFVLDASGTMRASNGASRGLVGLNVRDLQDAAGKPFMREILEAAKSTETGEVAYHWLNPVDNKVENKVSQFHKVGDLILCVGYYVPRASAEHARALLDKAVTLLKASGSATAFKAFNDPQGGFVHNDEYVFVIGLDDGKYLASGGSPTLIGADVRAVHDASGKPLFQDMIDLAKTKGTGTVDYVWRNPATNAVEQKHTLIQRVDNVLLGVGYYTTK